MTQHTESALRQLGLSSEEASIYAFLVLHGPRHASRIAQKTGVGRTLVYKILEKLEKDGLVRKDEPPGEVAKFTPEHPSRLRKLLEEKEREAEQTKISFESVIGKLTSDFNAHSGMPGIRIFTELQGLQRLYDDVIREKKDILLIRSPNDDAVPELKDMVRRQIIRQVASGIRARVIYPLMVDTLKRMKTDEERLIDRRIVPLEKLSAPSQIIIYGKKVGITSYSFPLTTTVIENPEISETFRELFEYLWRSSKKEHYEIMQKLKTQHAHYS